MFLGRGVQGAGGGLQVIVIRGHILLFAHRKPPLAQPYLVSLHPKDNSSPLRLLTFLASLTF